MSPLEKRQLFFSIKSLFNDLVQKEQQNLNSEILGLKELDLTEERTSIYNAQADLMKLRTNLHLILLRINTSHVQQFTPEETRYIHDCLSYFEGKKLRNRKLAPSQRANSKKKDEIEIEKVGFAKRTQIEDGSNTVKMKISWAKAPEVPVKQPKKRSKKRKLEESRTVTEEQLNPTHGPSSVVQFSLYDTQPPAKKKILMAEPPTQVKTRSQRAAERESRRLIQEQQQSADTKHNEPKPKRKSWQLVKNETCAACQVEITPQCPRSYLHCRFTAEFKVLFPEFDEDLNRVCGKCHEICREYREAEACKVKKTAAEKRKCYSIKKTATREPMQPPVEPKRSSLLTIPSLSSGNRKFVIMNQAKPKAIMMASR